MVICIFSLENTCFLPIIVFSTKLTKIIQSLHSKTRFLYEYSVCILSLYNDRTLNFLERQLIHLFTVCFASYLMSTIGLLWPKRGFNVVIVCPNTND